MKVYTQEEFDALPHNEYGVKFCPTGDYSQIKHFGECCSFGEYCGFGEDCGFGECCGFGEDCGFGEYCSFGERCSLEGLHNCTYFACDRIGSEQRKTYFIKSDEGLYVRAGCFFGTAQTFEECVKTVHKGTKHERAYLAAIALARIVLYSK